MFAIRVPVAAAVGLLFSAAIFVTLARLVAVPFDVPLREEAVRIEFTRQRIDTPVEPQLRQKPERPPPEVVLVDPRGPITVVGEPTNVLPPQRTTIERPPRTGLPFGIDHDATPLVRVNPDYPPRAVVNGTEGWARVRFTITAAGTVRDAVIVASEPGTIFDDVSLAAITRWRYNPRVENGVAVERVGVETVLRFELEN